MYKYFKEEYSTIQEVKNEYRKLAFQYHPDKGGSVEIMQQINNEYDKIVREVNNKQEKKANINDFHESNFKNIIMELVKLQNITISIVGWYVWVGGDTKPIKDKLKELGMFYSSNQRMWYYNGSTHKNKKCSRKSWTEITSYFGCVEISTDKQNEPQKQLKQAI